MTARLGIIGGYLGSGKSTLVNRLLAGGLRGRVAVVVNDFGSVNIDADLIASASEDTVELTNGCICCQISNDASRTMSALATRRDLDHVLCEVSGVGDPGRLAMWRDFPGFSPGPVLVCADATAVRRLLRDEYVGDTVARQLAAAEVVLVTKTDLALPAETEAASETCHAAAPRARLILQDVADPGATATEALAAAVPGADDGGAVEHGSHKEREDHGEAGAAGWTDRHSGPDHASAVLECPDPVDVDMLARALGEQADRLIRAKGVVRDTAGRWHEVQLAGERVDVRPRPGGGLPPGRPALVLIAAGPEADLQAGEAAAALAPIRGSAPSGPPSACRMRPDSDTCPGD
ncbi:CobW family GTP-binding protein [Prauserella alba]|uniref:GTPase, G3E family n=1 Tax=Prauserella alba TaxID=176898 RepID=A0ABP4G147_9PSEU|nr:CobW family GTP-binding protein [Prauserella alba]MCP2183018.1 GTPase, G3E family [Prauserella alba]